MLKYWEYCISTATFVPSFVQHIQGTYRMKLHSLAIVSLHLGLFRYWIRIFSSAGSLLAVRVIDFNQENILHYSVNNWLILLQSNHAFWSLIFRLLDVVFDFSIIILNIRRKIHGTFTRYWRDTGQHPIGFPICNYYFQQ